MSFKYWKVDLLKKDKKKNDFGFNYVWTVDVRICYYDEVDKKVKI